MSNNTAPVRSSTTTNTATATRFNGSSSSSSPRRRTRIRDDRGGRVPKMNSESHECDNASSEGVASVVSRSDNTAATDIALSTSISSNTIETIPTRSQAAPTYFRARRSRRPAGARGQLDPPGELNQHDYGHGRVSYEDEFMLTPAYEGEGGDTPPQQTNFNNNNNTESAQEWACPRCTLLNSRLKQYCGACYYRNTENDNNNNNNNNHNNGTTRNTIRVESFSREDGREDGNALVSTGSSSTSSSLSSSAAQPALYVGTGALLGSVLGAAGAFVRGRPMSSGVLEGAMSGAVGGAFLQECIRGNQDSNPREYNDNNNNHNNTTSRNFASQEAETREQTLMESSSSSSEEPLSSPRNYQSAVPLVSSAMGQLGIHGANNGDSSNNETTRQPRTTFRVIRRQRGHTTAIISHPTGSDTAPQRRRTSATTTAAATASEDDPLLTLMLRSILSNAGAPNIDSMGYEHLLHVFGEGAEENLVAADEQAIRSLPTTVIKDPRKELPEDARRCAICLEEFESKQVRKTLPCLHGFHEECVDKWLRTNGVCPVCKHPVQE